MRKMLIGVVALFAATPSLAAETWYKASSDHFVVYSEGKQSDAEQLAVNLERLDRALRFIRGMPLASQELPDATKLRVYQFGRTEDIATLAGSIRSGVAGFFIPRAGRSVAFVPLREDRDRGYGARTSTNGIDPAKVLFHEYTHYFMFQHGAAAYPFWYQEGFAELFGTLDLIDGGFRLGEPPEHRASSLQNLTLDIKKLIAPPEERNMLTVMKQYSYGWLLVSYLTFEPKRKGQLIDYLRRINAGESNLEAAQNAFGDLNKLERDLSKYRDGRVRAIEVKLNDVDAPEATVEKLSEDEAAQMMLHIHSVRGVTEDDAKRQVPEIRKLVAIYPQSVPVLLEATEVEFDAQNIDEAEKLADRVLAIDPDVTDAYLFKANIALKRAEKDPAQLSAARKAFIAANNLDPNNPRALYGYYRTFIYADETPPESALVSLERSYDLAPFDSSIRSTLAWQLLNEKREDEAVILLGPIINNPHAGEKIKELRELVEQMEDGNPSPLMAKLKPKLGKKKENEDDDDDSNAQR